MLSHPESPVYRPVVQSHLQFANPQLFNNAIVEADKIRPTILSNIFLLVMKLDIK